MKKKSKYGRNPKLNPKTHCVMVRFDDVEWNRFLTMYEESNVYAKAVFLKAHFFGQKFKVLKVDKTLVDYYTKLSDFHAQFRGIGTNYNQVVKELRIHFSEKKAMALLYKLEECTIDLVKLSREIMELSREMEAKWQQRRMILWYSWMSLWFAVRQVNEVRRVTSLPTMSLSDIC